ncbi:MFS transporter [Mycoplasma todarodis]|uniref:Uncharacterized protein n=1 Tax=Mycoplasma todarodis TaxID=1937191 RepID=A0A4R0XVR9_9MOLU|nr:MFS transporter [Mycoplasma todarodis]TCG11964.1 hypothetical protein C4B25_00470 [Mycoplasma todarodis]
MSKIYLKMYLHSLIRSKLNIILFSVITISGIILNSIIGGNQSLNYSFVFALPSFVWMISASLMFSVEFYLKTKVNGTELIFASKSIKREKNVILRTVVMFVVIFISNSLLSFVIFIPAMIRTHEVGMYMTLWIIIVFASILIIFFCITFFSLICSHFSTITAMLLVSISAIGLIAGSLVTRILMNPENHNKLYWDKDNKMNYAKMLRVNKNGKVEKEYKVFSKGENNFHNKLLGDDTLNKTNELNSWLNPSEWIINPVSSLFGKSYKIKDENYTLASQDSYKFSLLKIKNNLKGDISQIPINSKDTWAFVSEGDFNPFLEEKAALIKELARISKEFLKEFNENSLSKGDTLTVWLKKLKSDTIWNNLNLSKDEKEILKFWTGINKKSHLNMYILNYYDLLSNKMDNFENKLKEEGVPQSHIEMFSFIFKGGIAKKNIFALNALTKVGEINKEFPFLTYTDLSAPANIQNIHDLKKLIHFNKGTQTFRIALQNDVYEDIELSLIDRGLSKIKQQKDWEEYIDHNNELGNLENLYNKLKRNLMNQQKNIREIHFFNNKLDIYRMEGYYSIESTTFSETYSITPLILLMLSMGLFVLLLKTYKRKIIR